MTGHGAGRRADTDPAAPGPGPAPRGGTLEPAAGEHGGRAAGRGTPAGLEDNAYAFLAHQGASPHVTLRVERDCALLSAPSDARPFNTLFAPTLAAEGIEDRVRRLAALHSAHGRTVYWWIGPRATPAGLPDVLVRRGFTALPPIRLMTATLTGPASAPPGAGIRPVRTAAELADFVEVLRAAYGSPAATARFTHRVLASLPLHEDAPLQHFVVRAGGRPVAVASAFRHESGCGLYNVATVPAVRGRGHGTAAARSALADGARRGAATAVLGAEPGALGLYRRLGFTARGTLARFSYTPG